MYALLCCCEESGRRLGADESLVGGAFMRWRGGASSSYSLVLDTQNHVILASQPNNRYPMLDHFLPDDQIPRIVDFSVIDKQAPSLDSSGRVG